MTSRTALPQNWSGRPRKLAGCAGDRSGIAATEFAIALPLLLLAALATCDFGRIAHFHQVVANAARTGAETGATHRFTDFTRDSWEAEIRQAVTHEMENIPEFDEDEMLYELTPTLDADGIVRIVVEVSYPFRPAVAWPALPAEVLLHKHVEFRQFR
jgi:hypothetical protein